MHAGTTTDASADTVNAEGKVSVVTMESIQEALEMVAVDDFGNDDEDDEETSTRIFADSSASHTMNLGESVRRGSTRPRVSLGSKAARLQRIKELRRRKNPVNSKDLLEAVLRLIHVVVNQRHHILVPIILCLHEDY